MDQQHECETDEVESTCPTCKRTFGTLRGMRIHHSCVHGTKLPNRICGDCETKFYDKNGKRTYCDECYSPSGSGNPNWNGGKETSICANCDDEFEYYPSSKSEEYCHKCVRSGDVTYSPPSRRDDSTKTTVHCSYCSARNEVYKQKAERREEIFCDRMCYRSWLSDGYRREQKWCGQDNPNWNGGVDCEEYYGKGWPSARNQALQRDEYTCQRCSTDRDQLGRNPDVHHITPVRTFENPRKAHTLENLISLCRDCHLTVERGIEQSTKEDSMTGIGTTAE